MKIVLLETVKNIGKKFDIRDVADGYARNFLIPRQLAEPATKARLEEIETLKVEKEKRAKQELESTQKLASALDGLELEIPMKMTENDQLFAAVTPQILKKMLLEKGYEVKKDQIILEKSIKEVGEHEVKLDFDHNLEATIKVVVTPEK